VGTPVQAALSRLLEIGAGVRASIQKRIEANLRWLRERMKSAPACTLYEPEAGWCIVLRLPATHSDEEWALALLGQGVRVQPGYLYDFAHEAVLVLSLLPPGRLFQEGVSRILACAGS